MRVATKKRCGAPDNATARTCAPRFLPRYLLVLLCATGLASCASILPPPLEFESARSELDQAVQALDAAPQPDSVSEALLPPITVQMPQVDGRPIEQRFDLQVSKAPADQVFLAVVAGTRYSMVVDPDVKGSISINLKDVTVFEALETIREVYGFEYVIHGTRIMIKPNGLQTRIFQVNYLVSKRKGETEVRISSGAISDSASSNIQGGTAASLPGPATAGDVMDSSRIKTSSENDLWSEITAAVRAMIGLEDGRKVVASPQGGVIVVRAFPAELRSVAELLGTMSEIVERQVMLEAKIINVRLSDGAQTGVNWAAFNTGTRGRFAGGIITPGATLSPTGTLTAFTARNDDGTVQANSNLDSLPGAISGFIGSGGGTPGTLLGLAFQTDNFAALISFLETQGELSVLSSPRIATLNNQKAVLKVGTDEFFVTNVTTNVTVSGLTAIQSPTITTKPFFSGVALDVTPQIDDNNVITLHIHPSVSSVTEVTKQLDLGDAGTFTLPLASSDISESDTVVRVMSGHIVAIGGLMKEIEVRNRRQVPGLGDLPVVGAAFGNSQRATQKSELVILLKPTVITTPGDWKKDLVDTRDRIEIYRRPDTANSSSSGMR